MSERMQALHAELAALKDGEGKINAVQAVRWAREHPESALHERLDWNDATAAEAHRVWQVRQLIAVFVTPTGAREFVSLSIDRDEGGYRRLEDVGAVPDLREILLKDALNELERLRQRYAVLQELNKVWEETDKVRRGPPPPKGGPKGPPKKRR